VGDVVRLIDTHTGFSPDDQADLGQWAIDWSTALRDGEYGRLKSITIVVEGMNGTQAVLSQSMNPMDGVRLAGLLVRAMHRTLDGRAGIEEFNGDD